MGRASRLLIVFFFSSRRRHTRFDCDWSSDVCSSDLRAACRAGLASVPRVRTAVFERSSRAMIAPSRRTLLVLTGAVLGRSEEHTSELQSQSNLVCRLLLEKKKKNK